MIRQMALWVSRQLAHNFRKRRSDMYRSKQIRILFGVYLTGEPQGYRTCTNDLDACLHAELIKLAILMGHITKEVYTPTIIDFDKVALYSAKLKSWHSSLPESLGLYRAVSGNDSKQRSTILLAHCSYLSCIILLTRRICVERIDGGVKGLDEPSQMAIANEYADMCISAGRQLATVLLPSSVRGHS